LPQPTVNSIESDLGIYSIFAEEDTCEEDNPNPWKDSYEIWHLFFDGAASSEGNGARI